MAKKVHPGTISADEWLQKLDEYQHQAGWGAIPARQDVAGRPAPAQPALGHQRWLCGAVDERQAVDPKGRPWERDQHRADPAAVRDARP